jgi:hypothetical protein
MKNPRKLSRIIIKDGHWSWFLNYKNIEPVIMFDVKNIILRMSSRKYNRACSKILELPWRNS